MNRVVHVVAFCMTAVLAGGLAASCSRDVHAVSRSSAPSASASSASPAGDLPSASASPPPPPSATPGVSDYDPVPLEDTDTGTNPDPLASPLQFTQDTLRQILDATRAARSPNVDNFQTGEIGPQGFKACGAGYTASNSPAVVFCPGYNAILFFRPVLTLASQTRSSILAAFVSAVAAKALATGYNGSMDTNLRQPCTEGRVLLAMSNSSLSAQVSGILAAYGSDPNNTQDARSHGYRTGMCSSNF